MSDLPAGWSPGRAAAAAETSSEGEDAALVFETDVEQNPAEQAQDSAPRCFVCGSRAKIDSNPIVSCSSCKTSAHVGCYFRQWGTEAFPPLAHFLPGGPLSALPDAALYAAGESPPPKYRLWQCNVCSLSTAGYTWVPDNPPCTYCGVSGEGPLCLAAEMDDPDTSQFEWIHCLCSLCRGLEVNKTKSLKKWRPHGAPFVSLKDVKDNPQRCSLCGHIHSGWVTCAMEGCAQPVGVICALRADALRWLRVGGGAGGGAAGGSESAAEYIVVFCGRHAEQREPCSLRDVPAHLLCARRERNKLRPISIAYDPPPPPTAALDPSDPAYDCAHWKSSLLASSLSFTSAAAPSALSASFASGDASASTPTPFLSATLTPRCSGRRPTASASSAARPRTTTATLRPTDPGYFDRSARLAQRHCVPSAAVQRPHALDIAASLAAAAIPATPSTHAATTRRATASVVGGAPIAATPATSRSGMGRSVVETPDAARGQPANADPSPSEANVAEAGNDSSHPGLMPPPASRALRWRNKLATTEVVSTPLNSAHRRPVSSSDATTLMTTGRKHARTAPATPAAIPLPVVSERLAVLAQPKQLTTAVPPPGSSSKQRGRPRKSKPAASAPAAAAATVAATTGDGACDTWKPAQGGSCMVTAGNTSGSTLEPGLVEPTAAAVSAASETTSELGEAAVIVSTNDSNDINELENDADVRPPGEEGTRGTSSARGRRRGAKKPSAGVGRAEARKRPRRGAATGDEGNTEDTGEAGGRYRAALDGVAAPPPRTPGRSRATGLASLLGQPYPANDAVDAGSSPPSLPQPGGEAAAAAAWPSPSSSSLPRSSPAPPPAPSEQPSGEALIVLGDEGLEACVSHSATATPAQAAAAASTATAMQTPPKGSPITSPPESSSVSAPTTSSTHALPSTTPAVSEAAEPLRLPPIGGAFTAAHLGRCAGRLNEPAIARILGDSRLSEAQRADALAAFLDAEAASSRAMRMVRLRELAAGGADADAELQERAKRALRKLEEEELGL